MNNNKVYVKIGRKYKDAFQSICALVNSGCIDRSIVQACRDDKIIETEQYIFEYTGDVATIDTGSAVGMMPGGATWFMGFRGGENDTVMGTWHNLLELVSTNYHKQYSLVEFVQSAPLRGEAELKAQQQLILKVTEGLNLRATKVVPATREDSTEDIYALSLRMELYSGVGEPRPLLCKLYFRKKNREFFPVSSEEAAAIDTYVKNIVSERGGTATGAEGSTETEIVDNVLNSLSKLISGEMNADFTDSVVVTNKTDRATLEGLLNNEPQDEVRLECKKLKVLAISHIQWIDPAFNVYLGNQKAFLAKMAQNNAISLYCCCNSVHSKLIDNNLITCVSPETGFVTEIRLNPEREDLGITAEQLESIQRESAFADHFFPISCSELARRNIDCLRYRCKCNTIAFEDNGKVRYKCADCPYPEVVYRHPDGTPAYTPLLGFDTAALRVVDAETEACRFCGRSYTQEGLSSEFLCDFCSSALRAVETKSTLPVHRKNYRRYAEMLPLHLRVTSVFKKKYCFENADRLIFFLGDKKFFFDKLTLTDKGMLQKPEKRQ